jgi:hypothetical protein
MSGAELPLGGVTETQVDHAEKRPTAWDRIEALLERGSEWLNPILVKEARQALKSRQFVITFGLLLLFAWAWTAFGIYMADPAIYYGTEGKGMLYGYFLVLSLPLLVVVPFSAFRSLAAEREDGTYELISITALNARQIVGGKLGSAILQMMVFFSALAPCVAFTYLLRGIDVFSIFFVLYYTFLMSLILSTLALLVATASRARHWQVLLSVLLLMLLFFVAFCWAWFIALSLAGEIWYADRWEFWALNAAILTFYLSFFVLLLWASGAQISFASDNRSTRLRWVMLVQQVLWIGWTCYLWVVANYESGVIAASVCIAAIYWVIMGSLMVGEYPQLSPRVKRELPQTFLGRTFLTWFNPGSGTGYVFAVLNMVALGVMLLCMVTWQLLLRPNNHKAIEVIWIIVLLVAYFAAYLGATRLLVMLARQVASVGMVFSLLVSTFLILAGMAGPWLFQYWLFGYQNEQYTELQITNWAWTLMEAAEDDITDHILAPIVVIAGGLLIFVLNVILSAREIAQVRTAAPQRVLEEEAKKLPAFKPKKSSPWDEDDDEPALLDIPPGT